VLVEYKQGHKKLFIRKLYCPKCKVWAYKTHKCPPSRLIALTVEMREIVDKLTELGIEVDGASCYVREHLVQGFCIQHILIAEVHLAAMYPEAILNEMPKGWSYYTHTVTTDHWPISTLVYSHSGCWLTYEAMKRQIKAVVTRFIKYLNAKDRDGLKAVILLIDC
jgi:hypothetical protein